MSLALYRKYRPATFAELKGQEHVAEPLQQALRSGRINHAYLFSGPRGCGKTSSARILARSLNCEQGPTPEPCGVCDSCVALGPAGSGHIDVIEIDAASHGGVDDARDLRERAFFAPVSARFKIYIIDEAHMVTREGFNALLKLVEEPPPHLKFIFATTEPEKVIGTIRSRTHHYPFRLIPPGTLRELLEEILDKEGVPYEPTAIPLVVRAGAGSARDSESILDQLLAGAGAEGITYARAVSLLGYTDASLLEQVVDAFAAHDGAAVFAAVDRVMEGGQDPRRFAGDLLERLRDLVILANVPEAGSSGLIDVPADQLERMQVQVSRLGPAELSRAAEILHAGLVEMRGATAPRLLLELICARILLPGAGEDEASLMARLERLERRVEIGAEGAPQVPVAAPRPSPPVVAPPAVQRPAAPPSEPPPPKAAAETQPKAAVPEAPPPVPTPATTATPPPPGGVDVAALRRRWPEILDHVKHENRVAWVLLMDSVEIASLDGNVLTLAFGKEGNRRGFAGKDAVLRKVLNDLFGVDWRIDTVLDNGGGRGAKPGPTPAPDAGGWNAAPVPSGRQDTAPEPPPPPPPTAPPPDDDWVVAPVPADPAESAPPEPPASEALPQEAPPPLPTEPPPPPEPVLPKPAAPADVDAEIDPLGDEDADVGGGLTGMALIERELGGRVIHEFEAS